VPLFSLIFFAYYYQIMREICFEIVELESGTYHPLIAAEFPGLEKYCWVIDSGASKSVFDVSLTDYYFSEEEVAVMATGLGKEVVETGSGTISELIMGGINFGALKVALVDFQHINNEYAKFTDKKIAGLIGCDFLFSRKAVLDFDRTTLLLYL